MGKTKLWFKKIRKVVAWRLKGRGRLSEKEYKETFWGDTVLKLRGLGYTRMRVSQNVRLCISLYVNFSFKKVNKY